MAHRRIRRLYALGARFSTPSAGTSGTDGRATAALEGEFKPWPRRNGFANKEKGHGNRATISVLSRLVEVAVTSMRAAMNEGSLPFARLTKDRPRYATMTCLCNGCVNSEFRDA
jgi:hypothetical protein